ncbi:MAG: YlbF family regulator [Clostridia bacterium]|nr:YlbF family regulator [Clostridia bacterium]
MDIIELSRELGRKIQQEESYINMQAANKACEEDEALQALIGEFNLKKLALNEKISAPEQDKEAVAALNTEMRKIYADIMVNENMIKLNDSKAQFDTIINRVFAIVSNSANGEDPNTTDYQASCSGSCSTCSGCH